MIIFVSRAADGNFWPFHRLQMSLEWTDFFVPVFLPLGVHSNQPLMNHWPQRRPIREFAQNSCTKGWPLAVPCPSVCRFPVVWCIWHFVEHIWSEIWFIRVDLIAGLIHFEILRDSCRHYDMEINGCINTLSPSRAVAMHLILLPDLHCNVLETQSQFTREHFRCKYHPEQSTLSISPKIIHI